MTVRSPRPEHTPSGDEAKLLAMAERFADGLPAAARTSWFYSGPEEAVRGALHWRLGRDVYYAVNPRRGEVGAKDGVGRVVALHCEIDPPAEQKRHPARRSAWKERRRR